MAERIDAVVEFNYEAHEPDELTIQKGDIVNDIRKQPGGWWEGTLVRTGKRGMFPDNFVKVVELDSANMDVPLRQAPGRRCRVLFSYQPANDDELELQVGDIIDVLSEVEEGWWRGKLHAQVGVFPSNFVSEVFDDVPETKEASHRKTSKSSLELEPYKQPTVNSMHHDDKEESDVPELPPKPMKELCRVMYPYEAVNDDELTLREGDVITLISRDGQDMGWWRGELHGKVGVFPDNFVQVIATDESTKPARPPVKTNMTTNRVKDSITRPSVPQTTAQRKSIELPPKPGSKSMQNQENKKDIFTKVEQTEPGQAVSPEKNYKFDRQLKVLLKRTELTSTHTGENGGGNNTVIEEQHNNLEDIVDLTDSTDIDKVNNTTHITRSTNQNKYSIKRKRVGNNTLEKFSVAKRRIIESTMMKFMNTPNTSSRMDIEVDDDKAFFNSLIPAVKELSLNSKLAFRSKVLMVLYQFVSQNSINTD